jgi:membrane associated rhomboid family serine protease
MFYSEFKANPENSDYIKESIRFASSLYNKKANAPLIGASGAVFGILMAFGMTFPNNQIFIFPIPVPIKAWVYVTFYGLLELFQGVKAAANDNVAHTAHIGGMIFAYIMIRMWRKNN